MAGALISVIHSAHATHATAAGHLMRVLLLRQLGDHRFGGDEEAGHGGRILQRAAHDLGRVDDTLGDEVTVGKRLGVVTVAILGVLEDLADDHGAILTGVLEDLTRWGLQRLFDDIDADLLVLVVDLQAVEVT